MNIVKNLSTLLICVYCAHVFSSAHAATYRLYTAGESEGLNIPDNLMLINLDNLEDWKTLDQNKVNEIIQRDSRIEEQLRAYNWLLLSIDNKNITEKATNLSNIARLYLWRSDFMNDESVKTFCNSPIAYNDFYKLLKENHINIDFKSLITNLTKNTPRGKYSAHIGRLGELNLLQKKEAANCQNYNEVDPGYFLQKEILEEYFKASQTTSAYLPLLRAKALLENKFYSLGSEKENNEFIKKCEDKLLKINSQCINRLDYSNRDRRENNKNPSIIPKIKMTNEYFINNFLNVNEDTLDINDLDATTSGGQDPRVRQRTEALSSFIDDSDNANPINGTSSSSSSYSSNYAGIENIAGSNIKTGEKRMISTTAVQSRNISQRIESSHSCNNNSGMTESINYNLMMKFNTGLFNLYTNNNKVQKEVNAKKEEYYFQDFLIKDSLKNTEFTHSINIWGVSNLELKKLNMLFLNNTDITKKALLVVNRTINKQSKNTAISYDFETALKIENPYAFIESLKKTLSIAGKLSS